MALLTLVRHGQSTYNLSNLFTGNLDVPLTSTGRKEALQAGKKLVNYKYSAAYTSMLIRAQETLLIILTAINETTIPVIKNAALNERGYGSLQGLSKTEIAAQYGDAQVEIWRRSYDVRPPGGESLEDTFNRTVTYYKTVIEPTLQAGENILIVAHGNSLRALTMYLENLSAESIAKVNIATGIPAMYHFDSAFNLSNVIYL